MAERAESLWQKIVVSCRAPICVFDTEFRLIAFNKAHNDAFFRVNGYCTQIGDVFPDLFLPEQALVMRRLMARALTGEVFCVLEEFGNPALCKPCWEISYAPLRDETGEIIGAFHLAQDISARLRAEAALAATQQVISQSKQMDALVSQASAGIAKMDADGRFSYVNDRYCEILGRSREELLNLSLKEILHPEEIGNSRHMLESAMNSRPSFEGENRYQRPDGAELWVRDSMTAIPNGDGSSEFVLAISFDVTDRRRLVEHLRQARSTLEQQVADRTRELRESRARLRTIFETSFGFQALISKKGILLDANATSLAAIAHSLPEVVGRLFWETPWFSRTPGMSDFVRDAVREVAEGVVFGQEILIDLPVGGWRWYDFAMRPICDDSGSITALVAEAVETTDRRRVEGALRQAQRLEAMGQFTGGVAHDFNNLLTPIIGALDMLQYRGVGGEEEHRLIDCGLQAADRAKALVQRLLAFARCQPLRPRAVDVSKLVRDMADLISTTCGHKIRLELDAGKDTPPAQADPTQLEMTILNLSVNSRDAMPDGGILKISVSAETIDLQDHTKVAPGLYIRLSVTDNGIGMDQATADRAIEPFFSTKGAGKGTGLGLSMAHGLAAQLGGDLHIQSAPGEGTRVDLWIPQSTDVITSSDRGLDGMPVAQAAGIALLVDDDELAQASIADMLVMLGYGVVKAASAEEALLIAKSGLTLDLLVTDHVMPGMSGAELARALRQQRPTLPILLVSGFAEAGEISPDLHRLAKPFRLADFAKSVTTITASPSS